MMKIESNKNLLKFLNKAKLNWKPIYSSKFGPFRNCFEEFPSIEELSSLTNKKCFSLADKKFGIFAYSDKFLIISYSDFYSDNNKIKIQQGILSVKRNNDGSWRAIEDYSDYFGDTILFEFCGNKRSKLESGKIRSLVKRLAKLLRKRNSNGTCYKR